MASQPQQQQLQQQQQQPPSKALCPQADLSALFGFGKDADDPIEPFTLYGTTLYVHKCLHMVQVMLWLIRVLLHAHHINRMGHLVVAGLAAYCCRT